LAGLDDWVVRLADWGDSLPHLAGLDDSVVRSVDRGDFPDHSADLGVRREQQGSGHHAHHVAKVEPEPAVPRGLFSQEAVPDELLRLERLAD
jgi:hypothetical protein